VKTIQLTDKEYAALKKAFHASRHVEFEMILEIIFEKNNLILNPMDINVNHETKTLEITERTN